MKSPILIFTKDDKEMGAMEALTFGKSLLLKKDKYNSNIQIVDVDGLLYDVKRLHSSKKINVMQSIKCFSIMVDFVPELKGEPLQITLEYLKDRVKKHVIKHKAYWNPMDDGRGLEKMINDTESIGELILMFR